MSAQRGELHGISYSPWTEKARWALDHHKIPYKYIEHTLLLSEPSFRFRFRLWRGDFTVPAWRDNECQIMDSLAIAKHADVLVPDHAPLIPATDAASIQHIQELSEGALDSLRGLTMVKLMRDPPAQLESLPNFLPARLKRILRPILIAAATVYLRRGFYREGLSSETEYHDRYRTYLKQLDVKFSERRSEFVVGDRFTFADIAFATALIGLTPPSAPYYRQGPATFQLWTNSRLMKEFPHLIAWRDALYSQHRPKRVRV